MCGEGVTVCGEGVTVCWWCVWRGCDCVCWWCVCGVAGETSCSGCSVEIFTSVPHSGRGEVTQRVSGVLPRLYSTCHCH